MTSPIALGGLPNEAWSCDENEIVIGKLRFHYLDCKLHEPDAAASGRTLVALHGMTSHGDAWRPVVAAGLSAVGRVICPDFRGHGRSDWTTEGYWLADYADDIVGLADALGVDEMELIGQSLGARVAMVLAKRLGARLKTMTLCDTGPEVARTQAESARAVYLDSKGKTAFSDEKSLKEFLRKVQPEWAEVSIEVRAAALFRENWAGKLVNRGDPDVGWLLGRAGLREVDDMWEGLRTTPAATLVLRGMKSYLLDDDLARRMCEAGSNSTYIEMPFGHYIPYEVPELLAPVLNTFLRDHA